MLVFCRKSGNEYLVPTVCASIRLPEIIPSRNIKSKTIVKVLVKFSTFVGLPKSVQSDQGSDLCLFFQEVMHELEIKQYGSSALIILKVKVPSKDFIRTLKIC